MRALTQLNCILLFNSQVLRHVVKEMLTLEENIPWDSVENYWKASVWVPFPQILFCSALGKTPLRMLNTCLTERLLYTRRKELL